MQMEASSKSRHGKPRATQYSQQTQDMLRLMMQESRLTSRQRKQINISLNSGAALPLTSDSTSSASLPNPKTTKCVQKSQVGRPQRRSAEACRSGNSYVREKFHPGPTRDLEKEKRRLQNILATGEEPRAAAPKNVRASVSQIDRTQQIVDEIEERRQFLVEMSSLGQEKQYTNIINTEIAQSLQLQRLRELQVLDKDLQPRGGSSDF